MMLQNRKIRRITPALFVAFAALGSLLTGCGGFQPTPATVATPAPSTPVSGSVFGGQQPIVGANIYLYAANNTGYGAPNTNLLTAPVLTGATGGFNITGLYTCTPGQQMYLVSLGGDPGAGNNSAAALMAALGDCSTLRSTRFISMNEVTTVAAAFALAPFMSGYAGLGSSPGNAAGLGRAFASAEKLADVSTGQAPGNGLAPGATAPVAEIYTLADILAACVNSKGGTAGDGSICGNLFASAAVSGGPAPSDTIALALAMAHNPTQNVTSQFATAPPQSPFSPRLSHAPTDWTLSITYTGFHAPRSTTVDAGGNIWVANSASDTVSVLAQTGTPLFTLSGNGLNRPVAVAIDAHGSAFVANAGASSVSGFAQDGSILPASPFIAGPAPSALAFDANGNLWVANSAGNSITELSSTGATLQTLSTGFTAPSAIAIDPQ